MDVHLGGTLLTFMYDWYRRNVVTDIAALQMKAWKQISKDVVISWTWQCAAQRNVLQFYRKSGKMDYCGTLSVD